MTHRRNTEGLKKHAEYRKAKTAEKVDEAIKRLVKNKESVNFNRVSEEAGVSKSYLYNNQEVRQRIETLRKQQGDVPSPRQVKREMTDASKDAVIAAKNKQINELKEENKKLKEENRKLRGKVYDSLT